MKQYTKFVKPSYDQFIHPTMQYADLVIPRGKTHYLIAFVHQPTYYNRLRRNQKQCRTGSARPTRQGAARRPRILVPVRYLNKLC
jgi:uridine kinase